jgi:hypothetical protein
MVEGLWKPSQIFRSKPLESLTWQEHRVARVLGASNAEVALGCLYSGGPSQMSRSKEELIATKVAGQEKVKASIVGRRGVRRLKSDDGA